MIEKNKDHYCLSVREIDLIMLIDILWWDTTHLGSQTLLELIEE